MYEKFYNTLDSRYGYLNVTFLNYIVPLIEIYEHFFFPPPFNYIITLSSFDSRISKILTPAILALAISGINALFCPTPIAAKIIENIAIKTD